jgi:hypothetical protein
VSSLTAVNPSVSLVLVCFNQEAFIADAVRSVLGQQCDQIDILISDDCSTDRTFEIAQALVQGYRGPHRVRLNRNEANMGISAHYTKCVKEMTGEWVVGAAGDDISVPHRVRTIMGILRRYPNVDGIGSDVEVIDANGKHMHRRSVAGSLLRALSHHIRPQIITDQQRSPSERLLSLLLEGKPWLHGATAVWRRRLITDFPPIGPDAPEDAVLRLRAAIGGGVAISRQPLVKYRTHSSNAWHVATAAQTPKKIAEQHNQRLLIRCAGLAQHVSDLEFAVGHRHMSSQAAAKCLQVLRIRQLLAEIEIAPPSEIGSSISGYLVNLAFAVRQSATDQQGRLRSARYWSILRRLVTLLLS